MKHTKIIATIGPASESFENLEALAKEGVNIFRLNFSHGTHQWHGEVIKRIRRLNKKQPHDIAIMLDTKGPEIRTGDLETPRQLRKGENLILTITPSTDKDSKKISVNYEAFVNDVEVGEKILVDNGLMNLKVKEKTKTDVICEVLDGGELTSRRHLNLPMKDVSLDAITKKDWTDIKFGIKMEVDFIALSFVRKADEIRELRNFLAKKKAPIKIIAKIESFEATKHLGTISEAADGIMVARGDLGAEIPLAQVPRIQRELIKTCKNYQKPVIVATQMLESMIHHPMPTRAEVTDVSTAVFQRADAIMLSGETASGKFPIQTVKVMADIATETEKEYLATRPIRNIQPHSNKNEFTKMAAQMAFEMNSIETILVITRTGRTAQLVSSFRPNVPVVGFTNDLITKRQMQLLWGVTAYKILFSRTPERTITRAQNKFIEKHPQWKGKTFLLIADSLVDGVFIPTLQIRTF